MKYYFITGTGSGIGKALAEAILVEENVRVMGISRHQTIEHPQYKHLKIDLSQTEELITSLPSIFPEIKTADQLTLVNNAGVLGEIGYVGEKQPSDFDYIFKVNVTAPAILMNAFLGQYHQVTARKIILNISSGAGKHALDGWASYCASKAALDLFSQTVQQEQDLRRSGVKVLSLAPGVVDTGMQAQVRETTSNQFSQVDRFHNYHASGSLASPETVGEKLKKLLDELPDGLEVVCRLDEV